VSFRRIIQSARRLLRALRIVIRADSDPARQVLFANLMQARRVVRLAFLLHARVAGTWASALLVSAYGLAYFLRIGGPGRFPVRVLGVAKHVNARRQIERIASLIGPEHYSRVRQGASLSTVFAGTLVLMRPAVWRRVPQFLRIMRVIDRRHGFLVASRSAAALAWYGRMRLILDRCHAGALLVSSDSNPEEVGSTAAARALGIPRIFVAHAYPTPFAPPLDFELSILEGDAAVRARLKRGPINGAVVLAGVEGESAPLDTGRFSRANPVIGIFAPKALSWTTLAAVVDDCRQHFGARQIVIRWHPSRLDPARLLHSLGDLSGIEESPMTAALPQVASRCDWVIADENSNVHLPVLKLGIPTIAVKRLGLYPESRSDMYGFAAAGIVFPPVESVRDVRLDELQSFFDGAWVDRFRTFDASYLRSSAEVSAEVRDAIWQLFETQPVRANCA
jgi:hypothetical protein